jgi:PIN domain nuclease of toxin-antitoxin system
VGGPAPLRLLLDTHVFLWSLLDPGHLSARVADALEDPGNELWISPLVIWEVLVLAEKRRVVLTPDAHRDPVDRFLAATALVYDLTLVTADRRLVQSRAIPTLAVT